MLFKADLCSHLEVVISRLATSSACPLTKLVKKRTIAQVHRCTLAASQARRVACGVRRAGRLRGLWGFRSVIAVIDEQNSFAAERWSRSYVTYLRAQPQIDICPFLYDFQDHVVMLSNVVHREMYRATCIS
jgi:hypothetical protein